VSSLLRIVFDPDLTPTGVPSITSVTVVSQSRLDVAWTSVTDNAGGSGLAGYNLIIDGGAPLELGIQTSYSLTGLGSNTTHTFRVAGRDQAGNVSAYSAQSQATTLSAPAPFNPLYPRLGSYAIGGQKNYQDAAVKAALSKRHVNFLSPFLGWENSRGTTFTAVTQDIKAQSTIGTQIYVYVITSSLYRAAAATNQAYWDPYNWLVTNKGFGYSNGLSEIGVMISAADASQDQANYRLTGKVVNGKRYYEYLIDFSLDVHRDGVPRSNGTSLISTAANPFLDGFFVDNVFCKERTAADYDRNGSPDAIDTIADANATMNSHVAMMSYLRSRAPTWKVMVNSADWREYETAYGFGSFSNAPLNQKAEGGAIESIENYESLAYSSVISAIKTQMDAYLPPKLGVLGWKIASFTDYAGMRYGFGTALLTDTYYYPLVGTYRSEDLPSLWYDEFNFDLGAAIDPVQTVARYQSATLGEGVWRRDFANGIVLVGARRASGATTAYSPVSLGGTFYRLVGTQAPAVNSGVAVTSVTLSPRDAIVLARVPQVGAGIFPLTIDSGGRFIRDNTGAPFLIHGDTPWSLAVQLTRTQIDTYLNDRQSKGFNTVLFNAIEHFFSANSPAYRNREGNDPFSPMTNFAAPNEAYWQLVDYIVVGCLARNMIALINPAYLGFGGGSEGWNTEVQAETAADLQAYGTFLANRYSGYGNVIWCMGGDYAGTSGERTKQWNIVTGIRTVDTDAIITAHGARTESAYSQWSSFRGSGFNLNNIYTNGTEYTFAATEYARSPAMPFIEFEGYYDDARGGTPPATPADCRRQAYASILSGACGHLFGNFPVWDFGSPAAGGSGGGVTAALTNLSTTATNQMAYVKALFTAFNWQLLQPRTDTSVVTTSLGSGATRIVAARASDGSFVMIWTTGNGFTVNLNSLSVSSIRARWYNTTDGTYATAGTFSNVGTQAFSPPGERVLVLDQSASVGGFTFDSGFSAGSGSSFADGGTATILSSGSVFGSKPNGSKPAWYWNPGKSASTALDSNSRNTAWAVDPDSSVNGPQYGSITANQLVTGSVAAYEINWNTAGRQATIQGMALPNATDWYLFSKWRTNFNMADAFPLAGNLLDGQANMKGWRIWNTGFTHDMVTGFGDDDARDKHVKLYENTDNGTAFEVHGVGLPKNIWLTDEIQQHQGDVGVANAVTRIFEQGKLQATYTNVSRRSPSWTALYARFYGHQKERMNTLSSWRIWYDILYLDDSWCRVVVTDQATWSTASTRGMEVQIPTAWAAGSITFVCRRGALTLAGKYLYVVRSDGTAVRVGQFT